MRRSSVEEVSGEDLETFRALLSGSMGLHFPKEKEKELQAKLLRISKTLGLANPKDCLRFLTEINLSKKEIAELAKDLSVGETYFFRHEQTFQALKQHILPEILAKKEREDHKIRIWSAACCTGEEPYSIAITLKKMIPKLEEWNLEITGTDINLDFLEKAKTGIYKEWSFRNVPAKVRQEFFSKGQNGQFALDASIVKMVRYDYLNLVEESFPAIKDGLYEMDLILCSNVLIYFTPEVVARVIDRLAKTLREGGWLVVSTVEAPFVEHRLLESKKIGDVYLFQKNSHRAPRGLAGQIQKKREEYQQKRREVPPPSHFKPGKATPKAHLPARPESGKPESPPSEKNLPLHATLFQAGDYVRAAALLENDLVPIAESEHLLKEKSADLSYLVRSLANQGDMAKAKEWCERSLRVHPLDSELRYYYGILLEELALKNEAVQAYKECLFLDPSFVMCHFSLGGLYLAMSREDLAGKHFRNVLELLRNVPLEKTLPGTDDLTGERIKILTERLINEHHLGR